MVPTVSLSGAALHGVEPHLAAMPLMAPLPQAVRLGRVRRLAHPPALRMAAYLRAPATPLPASTNWRKAAAASTARMYLNATYGCCVIAGKGHALGVWSANELGAASTVLATDAEVLAQYRLWNPGSQDNGCVITDVLDYMRAHGFQAGGKLYPIDGYVAVDWTNPTEVKTVQVAFGASTIGINLPEAWTQNAVWDLTNSPIVGGHDVTPIDYDAQGVYVASWGRIYLITWRAFTSRVWVEEYYAILAPLWYAKANLAPNGIDVAALRADLAKLGQGVIPDIGPTPPLPPPPPPPVPPGPGPQPLASGVYVLQGPGPWTLTGHP